MGYSGFRETAFGLIGTPPRHLDQQSPLRAETLANGRRSDAQDAGHAGESQALRTDFGEDLQTRHVDGVVGHDARPAGLAFELCVVRLGFV